MYDELFEREYDAQKVVSVYTNTRKLTWRFRIVTKYPKHTHKKNGLNIIENRSASKKKKSAKHNVNSAQSFRCPRLFSRWIERNKWTDCAAVVNTPVFSDSIPRVIRTRSPIKRNKKEKKKPRRKRFRRFFFNSFVLPVLLTGLVILSRSTVF